MDPIQNPLFKEPIGSIFRSKRQQLGLSIDDVARSLKYSSHLVEAIETEQWQNLGAPVFAKSYVNSYIKLLGLNPSIMDEIPTMSQTPALKSLTTVKVESSSKGSKWLLGILTVLGLAVIVAYFGLRQKPTETVALDTLITVPALPTVQNKQPSVPISASPENQAQTATSTTAVTTPPATTPPAIITNEILLTTADDCWVDIRDMDNNVLFLGTLSAGQDIRQPLEKIGKITLGNAGSVALSVNGTPRDLNPLIKGSVARFRFDSDGNPISATL
jgi:cytoskeleton protein RodZ